MMWTSPDYTVSCDGPDNDPRFRASVTVVGVSFHSSDPSRSSQEAQNKAAQLAVDHLSVNLPPKPCSQTPAVENNFPYKSQLHTYARRNCIGLPKYELVREGCAHALHFKASVTVNGQTFSSMQYFNTLKEAENDAARVAVSSLSFDGNTLDDSNFYKYLLRRAAQKEGISFPKYNTVSTGASHMPVFFSTAEIRGHSFVGDGANTKKQAERNAAKVAWCQLKERNELIEPASSGSQSKDSKKLELPNPLLLPPSHVNMNCNGHSSAKRQKGGIADKNGSSTVMASIFSDYQGSRSTTITKVDGNVPLKKMASHSDLVSDAPKRRENAPQVVVSRDGTSTPSSKSDFSSFLCNRVKVYPQEPDMVLPEGAVVLPFSDDTWVAVSLNSPSHEAKRQKGGIADKNGSSTVMASIFSDYQGSRSTTITKVDGNEPLKKMASHSDLVSDAPKRRENAPQVAVSRGGTSTPSSKSDFSSFLCNRVKVYPQEPDMVLPEGAVVLPFSDDTWVAVSLNSPSHEGSNANPGKINLYMDCSGNELIEPASSGSQSKDSKKLELPNPLLLPPSHVNMNCNGHSFRLSV